MTLSIQPPPMQASMPNTRTTSKTFSLAMRPEALNRPDLELQVSIIPNFFNNSKPAKPNEIFTIQLEPSEFKSCIDSDLVKTYIQIPTQSLNSPETISRYAITFHVNDPGAESNISSGFTLYNRDYGNLGQFVADLGQLSRESQHLTWRIKDVT